MTTPSDPAPTAAPALIQFDRAEYSVPTAAGQPCAACQRLPVGVYYTANNTVICAPCRDAFLASAAAGTRVGRFSKAVLYGLLAGLAGAILWFAVWKVTGLEIGLIAVVVGFMVGGAVRKGSNGRGGLGYQCLAVFLTYSCIVSQYVPDVYQALSERFDERSAHVQTAATSQPTTYPAVAGLTTADSTNSNQAADAADADEDARVREEVRHWSPAKKIGILLLFAAVLFAFAFAAPVLMGLSNVIGLLIIAFALWEAWKINRKRAVEFSGPHAIAAPQPSPPPATGA